MLAQVGLIPEREWDQNEEFPQEQMLLIEIPFTAPVRP